MILYYYQSPHGNFGDDLNAWLWPRLLPDCWDPDDGVRFAGIGTIVTSDMPKADSWIVFGSGAGYGPPPPGFGGPDWKILSVRGPLSAEVLGLEAEIASTDGALLISTLPEYEPLDESERVGTVFVPHHQALEAGQWEEVCGRAGIEFVDPTDASEKVIARIRRAKLVVADAMHAAIIADALRVPWIPVATSREINSFKWLDWTGSIDVPYRPILLPASSADEAIRSSWLRYHGQEYFVPPHTREAVLAHYRRVGARKSRPWWPTVQRAGERIYSSGLRRSVRIAGQSGLFDRHQQLRLDRAAGALQRAAAGPTFLSEERVWRRHTARLQEHLALIAAAHSR